MRLSSETILLEVS